MGPAPVYTMRRRSMDVCGDLRGAGALSGFNLAAAITARKRRGQAAVLRLLIAYQRGEIPP